MSSKPCPSAEASREFRILVAERDRQSRESLREKISSWGFQARAIESGQVLEEAERFDPDVLLIELDGPEKGGAGILHELRARGLVMPTIVMTEDAELYQRNNGQV
jgi:DNA-binding response OmpR family regulator